MKHLSSILEPKDIELILEGLKLLTYSNLEIDKERLQVLIKILSKE